MYYLQSRYYNPSWGRFINTDGQLNSDILGNNQFAYCSNNPVSREDEGGTAWDIVFDVISLASSVCQVVSNPADPWAWAGLAGDLLDLAIPFVGGIGETARAVNAAIKAADKIDDVRDVGKTAKTVSKSVRSSAVKKAWKNELLDVQNGGSGISRVWSPEEQFELLATGKVKGYQGHHMKSVKGYPELAGDPNNIQFLTKAEHLAAHGGNWRNITHGRYIY